MTINVECGSETITAAQFTKELVFRLKNPGQPDHFEVLASDLALNIISDKEQCPILTYAIFSDAALTTDVSTSDPDVTYDASLVQLNIKSDVPLTKKLYLKGTSGGA